MTHGAIVLLGSANDVLRSPRLTLPKLSLPVRAVLALVVALPITLLIVARAFVELESLSPQVTPVHAELPLLAAVLLIGVVVGLGAAMAGRLCALARHGSDRGDRSSQNS